MNKPTKRKIADRRAAIEEAAWWKHLNFQEEEIAGFMGVSGRTVRELIHDARHQGLFRGFDERKVSPERLDQLQNMRAHSDGLFNALQAASCTSGGEPVFRRLSVVKTVAPGEEPSDIKKNLAAFGGLAGERLRHWLGHCSLIGVAWGETLWLAFEAMKHTHGADNHPRDLRVIPTLGETLALRAVGHSSSQLALELQQTLAGRGDPPLSLAGVAAVIPRSFQHSGEIKVIHRFLIEASPAYRIIFGRDDGTDHGKPLVDRLDALVTSVSLADGPPRMAEQDLLEIGGVPQAEYHKLVFGDLGGVLLPRLEVKTKAQHEHFEQIAELLTGIRFQHYQAVARRAAETEDEAVPGVIVLATGAKKAPVVWRAIQLGIVNRLICDAELVEMLASVCKYRRSVWHRGGQS
jgi:hypothetical protein